MKRCKTMLSIGTICLMVALFSAPAHSVVLDSVLNRNMAKDAQLIFVGKVTDRVYQNSEPVDNPEDDGEMKGIPHTFVTFSVETILKGKIAGEQQDRFTLRFIGGMDSVGQEEFLALGGSPLLDIGDRGVFFVAGNQEQACPLIGWEQGFIYINENNEIFNGLGKEIRLSYDPMFAARFHPADIHVLPLTDPLIGQPREIDSSIYKRLSPATQQLLSDPENIKGIDPTQFSFAVNQLPAVLPYPPNEQVDGDFLRQLMPMRYRQAAKTPLHMLLYRDLNLLLTVRNAFSLGQMGSVDLREQSKAFLAADQTEMPLDQLALGNRRVLEDIYPTQLTRSRDMSLITSSYHRVPALLNHKPPMGDIDVILEDAEGEGAQVDETISPERENSERLAFPGYMEQLTALIAAIHTDAELKNLPAVQSADPTKPFSIPLLGAGPIRIDMPGVQTELSDADAAELKMLEENGGNPVLPQ
ncbi:MAG: hypothetical protein GC154_20855 [bacterium]|nr:hypothetical protein [bacterium]